MEDDINEQRKFTLVSTINEAGYFNNDNYTAHIKNNFSALYYCNDAAVISCSNKVLEDNTSHILFYKVV